MAIVVAPSRANASAMAWPIPRHDPVTRAILSFRRFIGCFSREWIGCLKPDARHSGVAVTCATVRQQCVNLRHHADGGAGRPHTGCSAAGHSRGRSRSGEPHDPQPTDPLGRIYAEWTEEFIANPDMSLRLMRWLFEDWQRATAEPEDVTYKSTEIGGVPGILVTPLTADPIPGAGVPARRRLRARLVGKSPQAGRPRRRAPAEPSPSSPTSGVRPSIPPGPARRRRRRSSTR